MRGRPPKQEVVGAPRLWADADDCPTAALDVLCRFAGEARVVLTLVACRARSWPNSAFIRTIVLAPGIEVRDRIAGALARGDVVVTSDKALGSAAAQAKAIALDPREGAALHALLERTLGKKRAQPAATPV